MAGMEPESVDAIVCDPPYGLGFMGKEWDSPGLAFVERKAKKSTTFDHVGGNHNPANSRDAARTARAEGVRAQAWHQAWATEALRVLKPGGYLLAFGGTRTFHRLTCAIEDAGFEIRDCLSWMYGSGFPKSLDVSKAIDKAAGATREVVGTRLGAQAASTGRYGAWGNDGGTGRSEISDTAPATPDAQQWQGWGTALKPAWEPIVMARKPLIGTVAANVLKHGTGAINVDGCRIEGAKTPAPLRRGASTPAFTSTDHLGGDDNLGRWPANVVLDEEAAAMLDEQSGVSVSPAPYVQRSSVVGIYGPEAHHDRASTHHGDTGGASRFFFTAKASSAERSEGLATRSTHPTVKPVSLMSWLVRMVTPPGGTVLDPFLGSGSTAVAAAGCGFEWIGIELDPEYIAIAEQRLGLFGLTA